VFDKIVSDMLTDEISAFLKESFSMDQYSANTVVKSLDFMTYHRIKESIDSDDVGAVERILKLRRLFEGNAYTAAINSPSISTPNGAGGNGNGNGNGNGGVDLSHVGSGDEIITPAGKKTTVKHVSNTGTGKLITTSDNAFNIQTTPTPTMATGPKDAKSAAGEIKALADKFGVDVDFGDDDVHEDIMTDVKSGMMGKMAPKIATPTVCQSASRNGTKTPGQLRKKLIKKKSGPPKGSTYDK